MFTFAYGSGYEIFLEFTIRVKSVGPLRHILFVISPLPIFNVDPECMGTGIVAQTPILRATLRRGEKRNSILIQGFWVTIPSHKQHKNQFQWCKRKNEAREREREI